MHRSHMVVALFFAWGASLGAQVARETLSLPIALPNRTSVVVELERRDVFVRGSQIQIMTPSGAEYVDPSTVKVFRGTLPNEPKSYVVASVTRSGLVGSVSTGAQVFDMQRGPLPSSPLKITANVAPSTTCGVSDLNVAPHVMQMMREKPIELAQDADTLELQLAIEADYQFFTNNQGNRQHALAYIAQVVGVTSAIYERDFRVRLVASNVRLWEDAEDPYPEDVMLTTLLNVFVQQYEGTMHNVQRDIGVYLTRRDGLGGIAKSIGGVCEKGVSYCAADLAGDVAITNAFSWDQIVLAHELGHVCGAVHTQNCFWPGGPLDSCVQSEGGICVEFEQTRAIFGTIMSYCHQRQHVGGGMIPEFHARHQHVVRAYLERAACVGARAAVTKNVLRGRFINDRDGSAIAGASLTVRAYGDNLIMAPPKLGPDTTVITAPDGSYEFRGLSDGVYTVVIPTDWATSPISLDAADQGIAMLVTDSMVYRDIRVVRGRPVTMALQTNGDETDVTFILVSENLIGLTESIYVPGAFAALGVPYTRNIPVGSYTIVPFALGRTFTPARTDLVIAENVPIQEVSFTSGPTAPDTTAVVVVVSAVEIDGRLRLSNGDSFLAKTVKGESAQITSGNGVAVFEKIYASDLYALTYDIDSTSWAPTSRSETSTIGMVGDAQIFSKRARRFPLVAVPYELDATNEPYEALTGATRIISPEGIVSGSVTLQELPFPIRIGPHYLSKLFVYPTGDVVFADRALANNTSPLASYAHADFVIAAFSKWFLPDTAALNESGVWWSITGVAPNRQVGVEWRKLRGKNCAFNRSCYAQGSYTFQLRIMESSGVIIMWYDHLDSERNEIVANIGLRGADILDARVITPTSATINWLAPTTTNVTTDWYNLSIANANMPPTGTKFMWYNAAVGVDDENEAADKSNESIIQISPNPASSELFVRGLPQGATVHLVDMMGRHVSDMVHATSQAIPVDVRELPSGCYLLVVGSGKDVTVNSVYPILIAH